MIGGGATQPGGRGQRRRRRPPAIDNTQAIGNVLYTHYFYLFQVAGMVLLVAMIGAIVLTLRTRPGVRRQRISEQVTGRTGDAVDRASRCRRGERRVMAIGLGHYLTVAAILFTIGVFGIFLNRKNVIIILMSSS